MKTDQVLTLLRDVKSGAVSIDDARTALEGVSLSEEQYESAIEHGVFTKPREHKTTRWCFAVDIGSAFAQVGKAIGNAIFDE